MRHSAFLLVVVVFALMCGSCETSTDVTTFSSLQGRIIKTTYRDKTITSNSELDCVRSLCTGWLSNCAVSYNSWGRHCMSAPVNGWLIIWNPDKFTDIDPNWTTYMNQFSTQAIDHPAVLYLLDSVNRGTNLGSKGGQVNLNETGLTDWNAPGPRGVHSHFKYLISGASNRAEIPYKINAGSYHINFNGQYTVGAWLKTDSNAATQPRPIIEGHPQNSLPDFWFHPRSNQDQLRFAPNYGSHSYNSGVNATGKQFWRHVAAVYGGFGDVQFYLNGSSFGQTINASGNQDVSQLPDTLFLGNNLAKNQFLGAMACVTIHEKALSQAEVAALMTVCP